MTRSSYCQSNFFWLSTEKNIPLNVAQFYDKILCSSKKKSEKKDKIVCKKKDKYFFIY